MDEPVGRQRGHAIGQQLVQQLLVVDAKVAECVMIDPNPAAQPAIGQVAFAQPGQFARTADGLDRGVEPKRQEQSGINAIATRPMGAGLDGVVQRSEFQLGHEGSDKAHRVIGCHQLVEIDHLPAKTGAIGPGDTRIARLHRRRRDRFGGW